MNKNIFNRSIAVLSLMLLATTLNIDNMSVYAAENAKTDSIVSSTPSSNKIVAIVEGIPITIADFRTARKLLEFMLRSENVEVPSQSHLSDNTYWFLLSCHVIIEWAMKHNLVISDDDIDKAIILNEQHQGLPEKYTETVMKAEGVYDQYRMFMRKNILLDRISQGMMNLGNNTAIKQWVLEHTSPTVDYLVISSRNNRANYNKMLNLRSKINCKLTNEQLASFAQLEHINASMKDIDIKIKDVINDLQPGENKMIIDDNTSTIKCIHLCAREEDNTNYIAESTMETIKRSNPSIKILHNLTREASIQILIPLGSPELLE